jgi:hypothetical protein
VFGEELSSAVKLEFQWMLGLLGVSENPDEIPKHER